MMTNAIVTFIRNNSSLAKKFLLTFLSERTEQKKFFRPNDYYPVETLMTQKTRT